MAIHAWLRHRAQRLQDEKLAQGMNQMQDYKQIDVLARYYNTHLCAYNKAFADLLRLKRFQMQVKKTKPCWSDALRTCKFGIVLSSVGGISLSLSDLYLDVF